MKLLYLLLVVCVSRAFGCSNLIVTPGASKNGSSITSYSVDAAGLYGSISRLPRRENIPPGTRRKIHNWRGEVIGSIPEASTTYDVVGNFNEYMVTIGETTFGGLQSLEGTEGLINYGTLMILGLQRAKTAREAVKVMTDLVAKYGYGQSDGESFTIADPDEIFVLELIGKGKGYKGAVWVAKRVPDGHVTAHANQARITTFLEKDLTKEEQRTAKTDIFYSSDVVSFAVEKGLYDPSSKKPFSFADVYDPLTFEGARICEARVYSFFSKVTSIPHFLAKYEQFALGNDLSNRMPWSVPVKQKLVARDIMKYMKDHHDGTSLNMQHDVGAGPWNAKFRDRPLAWEYKGDWYVNERTIGTQQTASSFVSEMRRDIPRHVGVCYWWGPDDASFSTLVPFYPFAEIPHSLGRESGGRNKFSMESQFWLNNIVANKVYHQWEMIAPIVENELWKLQDQWLSEQPMIEQIAVNKPNRAAASKFLSDQTSAKAKMLQETWTKLWMHLVVHYRDGVVVGIPNKGSVQWRDAWKKEIVDQAGDHFRIKKTVPQASEFKLSIVDKNTNYYSEDINTIDQEDLISVDIVQ